MGTIHYTIIDRNSGWNKAIEVRTVIQTAEGCPTWSLTSDSYKNSQARYDPTAPRFNRPDRFSEKYYSLNIA